MAREPSGPLPAAVEAFILARVETVEEVDVLMAIRRSSQGAGARQIAEQLGLSDDVARRQLERLAGHGLLDVKLGVEDVVYRYDAVSDELHDTIEQLAEYYASARSTVVALVTNRARRSLRDFAEAFRIRRRE